MFTTHQYSCCHFYYIKSQNVGLLEVKLNLNGVKLKVCLLSRLLSV